MKSNNSGMALVTVLCLTAILALVAGTLAKTGASHIRIAKSQRDTEQAIYVAEGGLERAASYVANGGTIPASFAGTIGDGTYVVTIIAQKAVSEDMCSVGGRININPNNNPANEFALTLPDGTTITRDDLTQNYAGYDGPAASVHVKPKGNGNQNSLFINDEAYDLLNALTYDISSDDMAVTLYNDHINPQGKALGHWWIAIAATEIIITESE